MLKRKKIPLWQEVGEIIRQNDSRNVRHIMRLSNNKMIFDVTCSAGIVRVQYNRETKSVKILSGKGTDGSDQPPTKSIE